MFCLSKKELQIGNNTYSCNMYNTGRRSYKVPFLEGVKKSFKTLNLFIYNCLFVILVRFYKLDCIVFSYCTGQLPVRYGRWQGLTLCSLWKLRLSQVKIFGSFWIFRNIVRTFFSLFVMASSRDPEKLDLASRYLAGVEVYSFNLATNVSMLNRYR